MTIEERKKLVQRLQNVPLQGDAVPMNHQSAYYTSPFGQAVERAMQARKHLVGPLVTRDNVTRVKYEDGSSKLLPRTKDVKQIPVAFRLKKV